MFTDDHYDPTVGEETGADSIRKMKFRSRSSPQITKGSLQVYNLENVKSLNCLTKYSDASTSPSTPTCKCPHVMIADDDKFQHLYYQSFFSRSANFDSTKVNKNDFRFDFSFTGDELIKKYQKLRGSCVWGRPLMMILDFNMGKNAMNGILTAIKLKELGFKGPIILRTSDSYETLIKSHKNLDKLLQSKIIDRVLGKDDLQETKITLQEYLDELLQN
mmetsp:Transcript_26319/g.23194  ORF Transcript_26319/g.23194 Transcript_26319/m.23194 type:complete len:218 (+) Transcript_26319:69-722(+)